MEKFEPNLPDVQYCLSISYGKDSLACLGACEQLGWRIDRIIHAEIWATDEISADLPPMVEFKKKADEIIKERWGITVEHFSAGVTFDELFHCHNKKQADAIYGFPNRICKWCNSKLKVAALKKAQQSQGEKTVSLIGIAADEPERLARLDGIRKISPLAAVGWQEADCMKWCIDNNLRSPTYDNANRGGCWFCYNATVDEMRHLRKEYPNLWKMILNWEREAEEDAERRRAHGLKPNVYKAGNGSEKVGSRAADYERRFQAEDDGFIVPGERFRWSDIDEPQFRIEQYL